MGVYEKPGQRRWRVKSKHEVTAISSFDLDGDGQPELISGWANGKFEVRSDRTGEVIYKDTLGAAVSAILQADYRCDGHTQVIVCSQDGEVRGYLPAGEGLGAADGAEGHVEEDTLRELYQRKQELAFELKQYEEHAKKHKGGERAAGLVAPDTKISARLVPAPAEGCLYLTLQSSNEARIKAHSPAHAALLFPARACPAEPQACPRKLSRPRRPSRVSSEQAAVVFAERVFEGESLAVHAKDPTTELGVPLRPPKDVAAELHVKALAGGRAMPVVHLFEPTYPGRELTPTPMPAGRAPAPRLGTRRPPRPPPPLPTPSPLPLRSCPSSQCTSPLIPPWSRQRSPAPATRGHMAASDALTPLCARPTRPHRRASRSNCASARSGSGCGYKRHSPWSHSRLPTTCSTGRSSLSEMAARCASK